MSGTKTGIAVIAQGGDLILSFFQGKTLNFPVIYGGSDPVDVTGHSAHFQARDGDGLLVIDLSDANGGIVLGGADGRITLKMPAAQTAALAVTSGVHELELVTPAGDVYRLFSGSFSIIPEVVK